MTVLPMNNRVNLLIISKRDFPNNFWEKVAMQLQLLLESGHICTVCELDGGKGTVGIEYVSLDPNQSSKIPYFLEPEEAELVEEYRELAEKQKAADLVGVNDDNNGRFDA